MADKVVPGPVDRSACIREAVCVHTKKIYASCRDKDCIEDLPVYPVCSSQAYIDAAMSIRPRSAELLYADVHVDEIAFNRGYYAVDVTYFYRIKGEALPGCQEITGLSVFNKRVILFGSEGNAKTFSSGDRSGLQAAQPTGLVEVVDPIALSMRIADVTGGIGREPAPEIPREILSAFGEGLNFGEGCKLWYTTLGQFSVVRLERDSQLVIPVYDYCIPEEECDIPCADDPCTLFERIRFPVEEFNPPDRVERSDSYRTLLS